MTTLPEELVDGRDAEELLAHLGEALASGSYP
jgi:hypothetical protein